MSFFNQVAIITGASSGIGWDLAKQLAANGAKVGIMARRQDKLEKLADEIRQAGGQCAWAMADVAFLDQTRLAIEHLRKQLGPVDLLIANAGIGVPTPLEPDTEKTDYMFRVNTLGVIYAIDAVLPEMLSRGSGHLVGISSLAAYKGLPGESGYCASKAAVNTYLEGLRIALRKKGIKVTTVCPGFVKTPMTDINDWPMPFLLSSEEAARRILRAIRRQKKVFNFPWQTTFLMKLTRWLPDRWLHRIFRQHTMDPAKPTGESSSQAGSEKIK